MKDSPNCCNSGFSYLWLTRAGRLRALGSYLFTPSTNRSHTEADQLTFARRCKRRSRNAKMQKDAAAGQNDAKAMAQKGRGREQLEQ
jgi:hypothetical protein